MRLDLLLILLYSPGTYLSSFPGPLAQLVRAADSIKAPDSWFGYLESMKQFKKNCVGCGKEIVGARNKRKCVDCVRYKPRPKQERRQKDKFDELSLTDREFRSYLLGFCCSDGHVESGGKRVVWYESTDLEIVEKITKRLGYTRKIQVIPDRRGYKTVYAGILFGRNAQVLINLGLCDNKEELTIDRMDIDLYPFLRGLLDGDGSIELRQNESGLGLNIVEFLGRRKLLESIERKMGRKFCWYKERGTWSARVGGLFGVDLLKKMYENATIFLQRKYEIFKKLDP